MRARTISSIIGFAVALLAAAPSAAYAAFAHTVVPGESLSSVAAADGLTVAQLAAENGVSPYSEIQTGRTLLIPAQQAAAYGSGYATTYGSSGSEEREEGEQTAEPVNAAPGSSLGSGYLVAPGDTLSGIAARAGLSVAQVAAANGLDPNGVLYAGSVLRLSGTGTHTTEVSTTTTSGESATTQPVGSAAEGYAGGPPYPTPERVSASQVGQIAAANGVPPSLAQAIGWQESGFNNDLVSSADARGVMQILPGTWDWINRSLTAGTPLDPASASGNVRGGVLLLRSLLNSTGGDPGLAAAGYYQGLPSVRQNGLYPSTQQYVNSVLALKSRFGG